MEIVLRNELCGKKNLFNRTPISFAYSFRYARVVYIISRIRLLICVRFFHCTRTYNISQIVEKLLTVYSRVPARSTVVKTRIFFFIQLFIDYSLWVLSYCRISFNLKGVKIDKPDKKKKDKFVPCTLLSSRFLCYFFFK